MRKKRPLVILFLISTAALVSANAQTMPATNPSRSIPTNTVPVITNAVPAVTTNTDQILILDNFPGTNFLILAAVDSLLETQIGAIAQTNSSNSSIQQFGQTLVTDHTKAYNDAKALADSMGITLRPLNDQEQRIVERFESLSGDEFDRVFTRYLIQAHIQDIGRSEVAAERSSNHNIRSYAGANLPILVQHLTTLLNIRETLLGNQALTP